MSTLFKTKIILRSYDANTGNQYEGSLKLQNIDEGFYRLLEFSFSNNLYNVNNNNNKVYVAEGVTNHTITLTNGYYTFSELATLLQTEMNDLFSDTISVTYNDNTNKLTISSTGTFGFKFATNTLNSARHLLGFNEVDQSLASSQTSDIPMDINYYKHIFIEFDSSSNKQKILSSLNNFPPTFIIKYSSNDYGGLFQYVQSNTYDQYIYFDKKNISWRIYDEYKNLIVELPNWVCVLECAEIKDYK